MTPPDASLPADGGKARTLQHAEVLRDGRQRHVEATGNLFDGAVAPRELRHDRASSPVGESAEGGVERVL